MGLTPQALSKTAAAASSAEGQQIDGSVVFRSLSQVVLPADLLLRLENLQRVELGTLADFDNIRQGMNALADELVRRSELLGQCVQKAACGTIEDRENIKCLQQALQVLQDNDVHQQEKITLLTSEHERTMSLLAEFEVSMKSRWGEVWQKLAATEAQLDSFLTAQAGIRGDLEGLVGRSAGEQRDFLIGLLEKQAAALEIANAKQTESEEQIKQLKQSLERAQAEAAEMSKRNEHEWGQTRWVVNKVAELEQVVAKLRAQDAKIQSELGISAAPGTTEYFPMTPEFPAVWEGRDAEDRWWAGDGEWQRESWGVNPPGLGPTEPPPPIPEAYAKPLGASEVRIHQAAYKLLKDAPKLDLSSGGEPWEIGMIVHQWKVEMRTVLAAIHAGFAEFFDRTYEAGRVRYEQKRLTGVEAEVPAIASGEADMETRLSLTLLKNLPQAVRQPVVETSSSTNVRCILLFESLHEKYAPGGREELESIQRYLRQLPAAQDFKGALMTLRRWKLAKQRAQNLRLPEQAPNEGIAAMDSLMRVLEKKNQQLGMKINLLRMQPDMIVPSTAGLDRYVALLEVECRRLASDQEVREARAAHSNEVHVASEAVAKGKGKQACYFVHRPGGCWRGKDCPFDHSAKGEGESKGKGKADKGKKGKGSEAKGKQANVDKPETQPKPKAKSTPNPKGAHKPKAKAEAKAAVVPGLLGAGCMARVSAARDLGQGSDDRPSESGSEGILSDAGSAYSSESTGEALEEGSGHEGASEGSSQLGDLASILRERVPRRRAPLWYLVLDPVEYTLWTSTSEAVTQAVDRFYQVDGPNQIAVGVWWALSEIDFDLPVSNVEIGSGQFIVSARHQLCFYEDGVIRPLALVHLIDLDTGREQMLALTESDVAPIVGVWDLEEARSMLLRVLNPSGASSSHNLAKIPSRPPTIPMPQERDARDSDVGRVGSNQESDDSVSQSFAPEGPQTYDRCSDVGEGEGSEEEGHFGDFSVANQVKCVGASAIQASGVWNCSRVLVDSGANEVIRPFNPNLQLNRCKSTQVALASRDVLEAYRTRDGELILGEQPDGDWILSVRRLRGIQGAFHWDDDGPRITYHNGEDKVTVHCIEENGLPYISWAEFKPIRVLLAKRWRQKCGNAVMKAEGRELQIVDYDATMDAITRSCLEEHLVKHVDAKEDEGEMWAKTLCDKSQVTCAEVWNAVQRASLTERKTSRDKLVDGKPNEGLPMWTLGLFIHGGVLGLTQDSRRHPWLTRLICKLVRQQHPDLEFLSISLAVNLVFRPHKDRNSLERDSVLLGLTKFEGGQLWLEGLQGEEGNNIVRRTSDGDETKVGRLYEVSGGKSVRFNAALRTHGTEPFRGTRAVAVGYTPRGHGNVTKEVLSELEALGFYDQRMKKGRMLAAALTRTDHSRSSKLEAETSSTNTFRNQSLPNPRDDDEVQVDSYEELVMVQDDQRSSVVVQGLGASSVQSPDGSNDEGHPSQGFMAIDGPALPSEGEVLKKPGGP